MNKKQIIQLVIIVTAFFAAGLILYNGFFKNPNNAALTEAAGVGNLEQGPQAVLPNGDKLDFNVLKKQNLLYNQASYPKLDPNSDYGIPLESLFSSSAPK
jgi:hypothetical protein